jgi:DNA-binding phage protein
MIQLLPHAELTLDHNGRPVLVTDDNEVADFLDDVLTEEHEITCCSISHSISGNKKSIELHFEEGTTAEQIKRAISTISPAKIEEIYNLNNS